MERRLALDARLRDILGNSNVYFQPPATIQMKYPCIVYNHSANNTIHADNRPYGTRKRYTLTIIDRDPDSEIPNRIAEMPTSRMDRFYTAENLNHWVFNIYD